MKTIHTLYMRLMASVVCSLLIISCEKEKANLVYDEDSISRNLKFMNVNERIAARSNPVAKDRIIIVSFNEWGRKKKNCKGFGLCDATWFPQFQEASAIPNPPGGGATILDYDSGIDKYYIDLLLEELPPSIIPPEFLVLKIDADIILNTSGYFGFNLVMKTDDYVFDKSLGTSGGFRVYLEYC